MNLNCASDKLTLNVLGRKPIPQSWWRRGAQHHLLLKAAGLYLWPAASFRGICIFAWEWIHKYLMGLWIKKNKMIGVREQVKEQGTCHRLNVCLTALFSIHTWEQSVTHICLDTSALCNVSMVWWCTWRWSCYSFLPLAFRETAVLTQPVQRLLKLSCLQHRVVKRRLNISSDV